MIDVIVVEDHLMLRDALVGFLARTGRYDVVGEAGSVTEALILLDTLQPDVVVADLSLPDSSAIDIVRALAVKRRKARVLIMTAFPESSYAAELLNAGAAGYVFKQQPTAEFLAAIEAVANGEVYMPPGVSALLEHMARSSKSGDGLRALTRRESEVFLRVVKGGDSKEIAKAMGIAVKTVETHRTNISHKVGVRSTGALIRFAVAHGIDIDAAPVTVDGPPA